jgi:hypothetical protein
MNILISKAPYEILAERRRTPHRAKRGNHIFSHEIVIYVTSLHPPPPGATQPIVGVYFTALYRALASSRTRLLDHTQ